MIVPQLEMDGHGAEVVGMFFFMDNTYMLLKGTEVWRASAEASGKDRNAADGL